MMNTTTPFDIDMLIDSVSQSKAGTALDRNVLCCALSQLKAAGAGKTVQLSIRQATMTGVDGYSGVILDCENTYMTEDTGHANPCFIFTLLEPSDSGETTLLKIINVIAPQKLFDELFGCSHAERIFNVISLTDAPAETPGGGEGGGDVTDPGTETNTLSAPVAASAKAAPASTPTTTNANSKQATVTPASTSATTDKK